MGKEIQSNNSGRNVKQLLQDKDKCILYKVGLKRDESIKLSPQTTTK
jgi:hypothetical protein